MAWFPVPAAAPPPGPPLRDIHLPPAPPWWPPAPGWWVLAAVVIVVLVLALGRVRSRVRRRTLRRRWLAQVDALVGQYGATADLAELAAGLQQLLRRAARRLDPAAVQQRGAAWRETLSRVPVPGETLDRLMQLDAVIYRPGASFDRQQALDAVRAWLAASVEGTEAGGKGGHGTADRRRAPRA